MSTMSTTIRSTFNHESFESTPVRIPQRQAGHQANVITTSHTARSTNLGEIREASGTFVVLGEDATSLSCPSCSTWHVTWANDHGKDNSYAPASYFKVST